MVVGVEVEATPFVESQTVSAAADPDGFSTAFQRLKPGPGQSPEQVRMSQRDRIHRAMVELAADVGYEHVTVRALMQVAGVSSRTFYGLFPNREECLVSSVDRIAHELLRAAARRTAVRSGRESKVRACISSLLDDLAERPKAARVLLVEALAAGRPTRTRTAELTENLERLLARLLATAPGATTSPKRLVAGVAAGVIRVATMTTLTGRAGQLPERSGELADWVLGMYDERAIALCLDRRGPRGARNRREASPLPSRLDAMEERGEQERILSATVRLATSTGFEALTVPKIRREAGVSRRAFDERFGNATDCFLAAIEALARAAARRADGWAARTGGKRDRDYRTMLALSAMAARNQLQARLVLRAILAPGRDGLLCRERLISAAAERLTSHRGSKGAPLAAEATVAAAWRIAQREVATGRAHFLTSCAPLLSSLPETTTQVLI
jgi:AcrR family transcriptional regulator